MVCLKTGKNDLSERDFALNNTKREIKCGLMILI